MSRKYFATVMVLVATAALAFAAAATSAGTASQSRALATGPTSAAQIGSVNVTLKIGKFVKRGRSLVAVGTAVAQFQPTVANPNNLQPATVSKQFTARVTTLKSFASTQRICPVLDLTLGPLDLNLLGLIVHLDTVHLTIRANSRGGVLGSLFCSLSRAKITLAKKAQRLTKAARMSGLNTKGVHLGVPLFIKSDGSRSWLVAGDSTTAPAVICPVLDLALGPLDLNLLGLLVHLDRVHLVITADSTGGVLGSLLCSLAGGPGTSGSPGS
jgi:hypothetical protein